MSEAPPKQSAVDVLALAIKDLMDDPNNQPLLNNCSNIAQIVSRIDTEVPGAAEALLTNIITSYRNM